MTSHKEMEDNRHRNNIFNVVNKKTSSCQYRILCPVKMLFTTQNENQTFSGGNGKQIFSSGLAPQEMLKEVSDCWKTLPDGSPYMCEEMKSTTCVNLRTITSYLSIL